MKIARLVQLEFATLTARLHQGFGPIATLDPLAPNPATAPLITWDGIGRLGQISDIDRAVYSTSDPPTLTLSGVDPDLIGRTLASSAEAKGRPCRIYDQHYDADMNRLDAPFAVHSGLMDEMVIQDDGQTATITLTLVTFLYKRRRPAYGFLNQASQNRLHPGDLGLSDIPGLIQRSAKWPNY